MASTPEWKIYSSRGEYIGCVKSPEYAAPVIGMLGLGATLRCGHRDIVWTEGKEAYPAIESYDYFAAVALNRQNDGLASRIRKIYANR